MIAFNNLLRVLQGEATDRNKGTNAVVLLILGLIFIQTLKQFIDATLKRMTLVIKCRICTLIQNFL